MTILSIIVKSYSLILLGIGSGALLIFGLGLYLIIKLARRGKSTFVAKHSVLHAGAKQKQRAASTAATSSDINAIAGDDPMSTQLDLARAYIESGKNQLAKIILESVAEKGSDTHQEEAQRLLSTI